MTTESLTAKVAEFAIETPASAMSEELRELAIRPVIDTIGAIAAGNSGGAGEKILEYARLQAMPKSTARRIWTGVHEDTPPEIKALASSALAHALDFDDEMSGVGHPSAMVVSALLALPQDGPLDGKRFLESYIIGFETITKVAKAIGPRHYKLGWHTTLTGGGFGATVAACRMLGLDVHQTRIALGICATLAGGLQRNFGTMTKPLHSGLAARNGVLSAQLAQVGFTANDDILDGAKSFFALYSADQAKPEAIDTLGNPWGLEKPGVSLKKFPCCYATHRVIDSIFAIQAEHHVTPDQLEAIDIVAPTDATIPLRYPSPDTGLQGKFSMPYVSSAAFLDGAIKLDTFTDEMVRRDDVRAIMAKVNVREDPKNRPEDPTAVNSSSGTGGFFDVTIRTTSGESWTETRHYPTGSPKHPLSWDDSREKFEDCLTAGGRDIASGMEVFDTLAKLQEVTDLHAVLDRLTAPADR